MKGILTMICYFLRIQLTLSKKHELLHAQHTAQHNLDQSMTYLTLSKA